MPVVVPAVLVDPDVEPLDVVVPDPPVFTLPQGHAPDLARRLMKSDGRDISAEPETRGP
jgi:hypothetical protein